MLAMRTSGAISRNCLIVKGLADGVMSWVGAHLSTDVIAVVDVCSLCNWVRVGNRLQV